MSFHFIGAMFILVGGMPLINFMALLFDIDSTVYIN